MRHGYAAVLLLALAGPAAASSFTTAAEVRPILMATKGNWVAVREYNGQDLLYFTHLESWRCGLDQIRYFVNEGKPRLRASEPCYEGTNTPNALKLEGQLPYDVHELGAIRSVTVEITLDDGEVMRETFERAAILMP